MAGRFIAVPGQPDCVKDTTTGKIWLTRPDDRNWTDATRTLPRDYRKTWTMPMMEDLNALFTVNQGETIGTLLEQYWSNKVWSGESAGSGSAENISLGGEGDPLTGEQNLVGLLMRLIYFEG